MSDEGEASDTEVEDLYLEFSGWKSDAATRGVPGTYVHPVYGYYERQKALERQLTIDSAKLVFLLTHLGEEDNTRAVVRDLLLQSVAGALMAFLREPVNQIGIVKVFIEVAAIDEFKEVSRPVRKVVKAWLEEE